MNLWLEAAREEAIQSSVERLEKKQWASRLQANPSVHRSQFTVHCFE
jgi:hypothetical protein